MSAWRVSGEAVGVTGVTDATATRLSVDHRWKQQIPLRYACDPALCVVSHFTTGVGVCVALEVRAVLAGNPGDSS